MKNIVQIIIVETDLKAHRGSMVAHFSVLKAHRSVVTGLYKRIQSQLRKLELESGLRRELRDKIRHEFKIGKSYLSAKKAQDSLIDGVKLENNLKKYAVLKDMELLEPLKSSNRLEKARLDSKSNQTKQKSTTKKPLQPLEEQQTRNYINSFIKFKHKYGKLPKKVDPIMEEELIKPLALFKRAEFNIKITEQKISRGPYIIRKARHNDTSYLRVPWKQSHGLHRLTLNSLREEQAYHDMKNMMTDGVTRMLYDMEGDWEKLHGGDDKPWKSSLATITSDQLRIVQGNRQYFKEFEQMVLPIKMKQFQMSSNKNHEQVKNRYMEMVENVQESTAYDELLSKETLPEIVKRYRFETRKTKHRNT